MGADPIRPVHQWHSLKGGGTSTVTWWRVSRPGTADRHGREGNGLELIRRRAKNALRPTSATDGFSSPRAQPANSAPHLLSSARTGAKDSTRAYCDSIPARITSLSPCPSTATALVSRSANRIVLVPQLRPFRPTASGSGTICELCAAVETGTARRRLGGRDSQGQCAPALRSPTTAAGTQPTDRRAWVAAVMNSPPQPHARPTLPTNLRLSPLHRRFLPAPAPLLFLQRHCVGHGG